MGRARLHIYDMHRDVSRSRDLGTSIRQVVDMSEFVIPPYRNPDIRMVSNSEIQDFKQCRRKWWLGWYRQLTLKSTSPVGISQLGIIVHRALQDWYVPEGQSRSHPLDTLSVIDSVNEANATDESTLVEWKKQMELISIMLDGYMQWIEETGADSQIEVIAPEKFVSATLFHGEMDWYGREILLIGKLDALVRRLTDSAILFMDHKTVQEFTTHLASLQQNEQMLRYLLILLLNSQGYDSDVAEKVGGALYNMLRKVKRTVKAKPPFYARESVYYGRHHVESILAHTKGTVEQIIHTEDVLDRHAISHHRIVYPTPSKDCTWKCPFVSVCPMFDDGSRAENMLTQFYAKRDPLDYYRADTKEDA